MPHAALRDDTATTTPRRSWRRAIGVLAMPVVLAGLITAGTPGWTSIVVDRGDTLSDIAKRYHTSVTRLKSANDLPGNGHLIYAGETLRVPTAAAQAKIAKARASKSRTAKARTSRPRTTKARTSRARTVSSRRTYRTTYVVHRVRAGDSLIKIARKYGARTSAIRLTNHLPVSGVVQLGRSLRIPVATRVGSRSTSAARRPATRKRPAARSTRKPSRANTFAGRTYPRSTVSRASANRNILANRAMPSRTEVRRIIRDTARRNGVSPSLALAVAYQESGFNPRVVSVANAIGAMQVIPATGDWASTIVGRRLDLLDARDNALAGVVLLRVLTRTASSTENAVAGYYQGLASVRQNGMFADTKRYVANVLSLRSSF